MTSSWDSLEDTPGGVGSASVNENLEGKPPGVSRATWKERPGSEDTSSASTRETQGGLAE